MGVHHQIVANPQAGFDINTLPERAKWVPLGVHHGTIAVCSRCATHAESATARTCTKTDCGLANRAAPRILKG